MNTLVAANVLMWFDLIERGLTTAATVRAMMEEGLTEEQITAILRRVAVRQSNLRALDERGTFPAE